MNDVNESSIHKLLVVGGVPLLTFGDSSFQLLHSMCGYVGMGAPPEPLLFVSPAECERQA